LARQRANDKLCRDFAAVADPFTKQIDADKDTITKSQDEIEVQLVHVEERIKAAAESNGKLEQIKALQAKLDQAGIKNNPHSPSTARDVEVQVAQFKSFLATKRTMLTDQIEHKKLRGLTADQYAEIKSQFNQYDKDKSGSIDAKELRACLYSLGEDRSKAEMQAIVDKFGSGEGKARVLPYEGFKEFMVQQLGDSDTKDEVLNGFELINKGDPAGKTENADLVLGDEQVKYLRDHAPKSEAGGSDYKAWVLAALAR